MSVLLIGSQRPTLRHEPPAAVDFELSKIALDYAEAIGYVLDEWQRDMVWWTFARRKDFLWAAHDVAVEVPRQNGKNVWLEIVELASLVLFGDRLITHSAHRADTSHEHFVSLKERIESNDELASAMPRQANGGFITSHGLESIEFANGARLQFKARMTSSGRGPRPQKIAFDEALVLEFDRLGSMAPATVAQRNPQVLFASSAPKATSEVLHSLRRRASNPEPDDRLYFAGWNNPQDIDIDDRDAWYRVNPSLGMGRMTEESLLANRRLMTGGDAEFLREHLGVPEEPVTGEMLIDEETWLNCLDPHSLITSHKAWALSISPDRKWATFGVAGRRADGRLHIAWLERRKGTGWIVDVGKALYDQSKLPLRIHKTGPENSHIKLLREAGVDVEEISSQDVAQATANVIDAANAGQLRHLGQASLDIALKGAVLRTSSDGAALWSQRNSSVEITALMACTVAAGGVPADVPKRVFAY